MQRNNVLSSLSLLLSMALTTAVTLCLPSNAQVVNGGPHRRLITQSLDEFNRVRLAGHTRPAANVENDRGAVSDTLALDHMLLQLRRPAEQEAALAQFLQQVQTKGSPVFH